MTNRKIIFGISIVLLIATLITALFLIIRGSQEYTVEITPVFYTNGDKTGSSPSKLTISLGEGDEINLNETTVSIDQSGKVTPSKNGTVTILSYLENYAVHNDSTFGGVIYQEKELKTMEIKAKRKSLVLSFVPTSEITVESTRVNLEAVCNTNLAYTFEILTEPSYDEGGTLLQNGTCVITGFAHEELEEVIIPSTILGIYDVTNINGTAFMHCSTIKSIHLPSTLTNVGALAFSGCRNLQKITFSTDNASSTPKLTIEASAFQDCNALKELTLPQTIKQIKDFAFLGTSLEKITVNIKGETVDNTATVADTAFSGITNQLGKSTITSVSAPEFFFRKINKDSLVTAQITGGTSIADGLFKDCSKLKTVTINGSITTIGASAFENAGVETIQNADGTENKVANLLSITLEAGTSIIKENAFSGTQLTSLVIKNSEADVAASAFSEVDTLKTVTAPIHVFKIIDRTNLVSITINGGDKVTEELFMAKEFLTSVEFTSSIGIDASAFEGCVALKSINLENALSIGDNAFKGCVSLGSAKLVSARTVGNSAFEGCTTISELQLGKDLSSIGEFAFKNTDISELLIPNSVSEIKGGAFNDTPLYKVTVEKESTLQTSAFEDVYVTMLEAPVAVIPCFDKSVVVNLSVNGGEEIPEGFYKDATSLTDLFITEDITSIGNNAFKGCTLLSNTTFRGVTVIGDFAFENCGNLSHISLGSGLSSIGECAFKNTAISVLLIPNSVSEIKGGAFDDTPLYKVTVEKESTLQTSAFENLNITDLTAPVAVIPCFNKTVVVNLVVNGGKEISDGLMKDATSLKVLVVNADVTAIGSEAFSGCTALESITLEDVKDIGDYSFFGCTSLVLDVLPDCIKSIGNFAFASSSVGKDSLTIGAAVEFVGEYAFKDISATKLYVLSPSAITSVEATAFDGVKIETAEIPSAFIISLTKSTSQKTLSNVTIVKSAATEIPDFAFTDCSALTAVTFADGCGIVTIGASAFKNCEKLNAITFDESLTTIQTRAFENTGFTSFVYPETVKEIKDFVFTGCKNLTNFKIHTDITSVVGSAFSYCPVLDTFSCDEFVANTVDKDGKTVNNYLPYDTVYTILSENVSSVDFTKNGKEGKLYTTTGLILAKDGDLVVGCVRATNIPSSITTIGNYSYAGRNVAKAVIPYQTESIGDYAFDACSKLTSVEVYDFVHKTIGFNFITLDAQSRISSVGDYAFRDCTSLSSISTLCVAAEILSAEIEVAFYGQFRNATHFGVYVFENTALTSFTIPEGITLVPEGAFKDCGSLADLNLSYAKTIDKYAFMNCESINTLNITSSVKEIRELAFAGCKFTTLNVANEGILAEDIDDTAFKGGVFNGVDIPGVTTVKKMNSPIVVFREISIENLEVVTVSGVGTIDTALFETATKLCDVTLKSGIDKIETRAFADKPIVNLRIENATVTVDSGAFVGVLTAQTIYARTQVYDDIKANGSLSAAKSVTFIGGDDISEELLKDVTTLISVNINGTMKNILTSAFEGCENINAVNLSSSIESIYSSAFKSCKALQSINLYNTVSIGDSAFEGTGLNSLFINSCVLSIGNRAFADCTSLSTLTVNEYLADTVTVGNDAFNGSKITAAIAPAFFFTVNAKPTLTTIDTLATVTTNNGTVIIEHGFDGYQKISSLTLYSGTVEILSYAFKGLLIDTISLPASVKTLGSFVFENTPINTVTVKDNSNLTSVSFDAFDNLLNGGGIKTVIAPVILISVLTNPRTDMDGQLPSVSISTLDFVVVNGGTALGEALFADCVNLKQVTIYEGISVIEKNTFKNCESLENLTLSSASSIKIKSEAFTSCKSLSTLNIEKATSISVEMNSFNGCEETVSFIFKNYIKNASIEKGAFVNCNGFVLNNI